MIDCLYFYPLKQKGEKESWILGHCAFRFTNWKLKVVDCTLVRGKDDNPCFVSPPQKKYIKDGKTYFVRLWELEDEGMFDEFQEQAKAAIVRLCKERDIEVPQELCELS